MNNFIKRTPDQKYSTWSFDNTIIIVLLLICIGIVYYSPPIVNRIAFLLILVIAYRSKKDYFWIAFIFILLNAPGKLFTGTVESDLQTLPFYPVAGGITIAFEELAVWFLTFKALNRHRQGFIFHKEFIFLIIFALFVFLYTLTMEVSFKHLIQAYRAVIPWILVLMMPKLLRSDPEIHKLNRLLFPIVFLAFLAQIYSYVNGEYFVEFFKTGPQRVSADLLLVTDEASGAARSASSMFIILFSLSQALFYYFSKNNPFSAKYIMSVIIFSCISVFLSAARGWIIAYVVILLLITFKFAKRDTINKLLRIGVSAFVIFVLVTVASPRVKIQIRNASDRLETIQKLLDGDMSAGGTLIRIEKRTPRVMKMVWESPVIGWGFSDTYFNFWDPHVGHPSILLNVGISGYLLLNILYFRLILSIYRISQQRTIKKMYGYGIIVFCIVLIGIYIVHSTSVQLFGLHIKYSLGILYSLIFTSANVFIMHARQLDADSLLPTNKLGVI